MASDYTGQETLEDNVRVTRSKSAASVSDMGSGQSKVLSAGVSEDEAIRFVPQNTPSILEIKRQLPAHCFQPTLAQSFYYVLKDLVIMAVLYLGMIFMDLQFPLATYITYPVYWYLQGTMMWALFVLGHDCGHGSFSHSTLINDITGNLLHSLILVPYYPWKVSHRHHHKNTGNIDKDEIFYPVREKDYAADGKKFLPLFGLGLSWFFYLFKGYAPRAVNHVNPYDEFFVRHASQCVISLVTIAGWVCFGLIPYAGHYGFTALLCHYLIPIFVFASWLVVTTFLHHQDENVPWYADHKWDFVRGNLSSVDRHYGWAHSLVHNIGTHQIHHLFSKIPHYHLEEATKTFRTVYPDLVRMSNEPIMPAFFKMFYIFDQQQWIKNDAEFHVYSSKKSR
uniref:Methyl-end desaturase 2 n=1 Tax=Tigriopus californicus TaxID=6832 RepID=A0A8E8LGD4_TIGCA|nr:methyl-end desaturase 2 [Tigriopus californicus]